MAKGEYKVQSVSFPDVELLEAAKAKAKSERRTLSNYICGLMEEDLGWHDRKTPSAPRQSFSLNETEKPVTAPKYEGRGKKGTFLSSEPPGASKQILAALEASRHKPDPK